MTIDFHCPRCGLDLHAPDAFEGGQARCEKCGTHVRVPRREMVRSEHFNILGDDSTGSRESHSQSDAVTVACPICRKKFVVELGGLELDGSLRVACDHCGVEKALKHFQRALEKQEQREHARRGIEAAERRRAEETAKTEYVARIARTESQTIHNAELIKSGSPGSIIFEGMYTPDISLLENERILDTFEASVWDLGLFGWLFGYKERMVLTNKRLMHFRKKIIDNLLEIIWLRRVKFVVVGQEIKGWVLAAGVLFVLWAFFQFITPTRNIGPFGVQDSLAVPWVIKNALSLFALLIGVVLIIFARRKKLLLSAGEDKVCLKLTRMQSEESRRFVDKVFAVLDGFELSHRERQ